MLKPSQKIGSTLRIIVISALVFLVLNTINVLYPEMFRRVAILVDQADLTGRAYRFFKIDRVPGVRFAIKGATISCFWTDCYDSPEAREAVDYLVASGVNTAVISPAYYQDSVTAEVIHSDAVTGHVRTPSDESVREITIYAHEKGLKVTLKPHVNVVTPDYQEPWRGLISPGDKAQWFASYRRFIFHYAELAQDLGIDDLIVGTELRDLTVNPINEPYWRGVINGVRQRFQGRLSYAATYESIVDAEYLIFPKSLWDQLDYACLNVYPTLSDDKTPLVSELIAGWEEPLVNIENWQRRLGKPVIFGEIGFSSTDYAGRTPWQRVSDRYNAQGQRNAYEAMFRVLADKKWLAGIYFFEFPADYPNHTPGRGKGEGDIGYTPWDKSAGAILREWLLTPYVPPDNGDRPSLSIATEPRIVTGAGPGGTPEVRVFDTAGRKLLSFPAYASTFRGGVRVTTGDVDGDGIDEIITGAGTGGGPQVRVFEADGRSTGIQFFAFHQNSRTGVDVAAADVNGDQRDEIIVSQLQGGEAWVKVYQYNETRTVIGNWRAFSAGVKTGAVVTAADIDNDGAAEIIVGAGRGGSPHVRAFEANGTPKTWQLFAYPVTARNGLDLAAGNIGPDGQAEIAAVLGRGAPARVRIYALNSGKKLEHDFYVSQNALTGLNVASGDIDQDRIDDLVVAPAAGGEPRVSVFNGRSIKSLVTFLAYDAKFRGGADVAVGNF